MTDFYQLVSAFDELGGYDILLPFILVFTLVFAVLQKIKLFGTNSKNINAVVSLVISIFFLQNTYLIFILQKFLPNVSIFLVIFLMFLMLLGIFSGGSAPGNLFVGIAVIVSIIAVLLALFSDIFSPMIGGGTGLGVWYASMDPGNMPIVWLLIGTAIFVIFVMGGDSNRGSSSGQRGWRNFIESLGTEARGGNRP